MRATKPAHCGAWGQELTSVGFMVFPQSAVKRNPASTDLTLGREPVMAPSIEVFSNPAFGTVRTIEERERVLF